MASMVGAGGAIPKMRARAPSTLSLITQDGQFGSDLISCAICFEDFKQPKVLPCLHTFCQDCIWRHYNVYKLRNNKKLSCPSCRVVIPLPPDGVSGLKNDGVSIQIRELLATLPKVPSKESDGNHSSPSAEVALLGACGGGEGETQTAALSVQIEELKMFENALQDALTKLRSKALHMYTYECHARLTTEAEIKASEDSALRRLITEQDSLYQQISDVRSVHDIIEDLLQKGSRDQIAACHSPLGCRAREVLCRLGQEATSVKEAGRSTGAASLWQSEFQDVMFNIGGASAVSKQGGATPLQTSGSTLLFKIGRQGSEPGHFNFPTHATFMPTGDIIVSDKNNCRLQVFDASGQLKRDFLSGHLKPRRARVSPVDGLLYVSDELSQCVKVFTADGRLVRLIGNRVLQCPSGLDFDKRGNVIVTDSEKFCLAIYTPDGKELHMSSFRFPGKHSKQPDPCFAAVNEDNQMVVSDMRNNRVKVLSNTGQELFQICNLHCPRGICVDPYGNIMVAEGDKHRVSMYSPHGKFIRHVLTKADGLRYPLSLDMNKAGHLMVTQCGYFSPHEVLVFQIRY